MILLFIFCCRCYNLGNLNHQPGGGNVQIIDQPFDKSGVRPRIDTGFIYEEVIVPVDYEVKPSPRPNYVEQQIKDSNGRRSRF